MRLDRDLPPELAGRAELSAAEGTDAEIAAAARAWGRAYAERTTVGVADYVFATVRVARAERALLATLGNPDLRAGVS
jgi:hypothetical protein